MALKTSSTCAFFVFFLCLSIINPTEAQDSPKRPFYNPNENPQANLTSVDGHYLMHLAIGTPSVGIYVTADTGSDLLWIQCEPCPQSQCFSQDTPLFDPKKSSTYNPIPCSSFQCATTATNCSEGSCIYSFGYGSGVHASFSSGNLATETLTFGDVEMSKVIFGCGHNNSGKTDLKRTGIIGLGPGNSSLISQMRTSTAGRFSYCLADQGSSTISFGGIVAGAGVVSTPLIIRDHYYLTLEAISVGNQRLEFVSSSTDGGKIFIHTGNIFIDTGVPRTLLPLEYHANLTSVISSMIKAQPVEAIKAEPDSGLSAVLCYNISSRLEFPKVIVHFRGADVELSHSNLFSNYVDEFMCSAFRGGSANTVYGNTMQTNFLIGYDLNQGTVSFKPTECAKK